MNMMLKFLVCCLVAVSQIHGAVPKVVVTIKPIHSLVANIMAGVGEPILLFTNGKQSPHVAQLTTSQALAMQSADILVWIGPSYEATLVSKIKNMDRLQVPLSLEKAKGMQIHPNRHGGLWGGCTHESHQHGVDGHLWLSIRNAKAIVDAVTQRLISEDAEHAHEYRANAKAVKDRLDKLDADLKNTLISAKDGPYFITHDSLQYIDRAYGTRGLGTILTNIESPPSLEHLRLIQQRVNDLVDQGYRLTLLAEPQFSESSVVETQKMTGLKPAYIDVLGDTIEPGVNAYFDIMMNLAKVLEKELNS